MLVTQTHNLEVDKEKGLLIDPNFHTQTAFTTEERSSLITEMLVINESNIIGVAPIRSSNTGHQ